MELRYTVARVEGKCLANSQSWLTHALTNIQDNKISDLDKLLPWNYVEQG